MPRSVLIDEIQIAVKTRRKLGDQEIGPIRKVLFSAAFMKELRRAVQDVFGRRDELKALKVRLGR